MSIYYTNVQNIGNNILYRGFKNGIRIQEKILYSPSLYLESKKETPFKTLHGKNLDQKQFVSIGESRNFIKSFEGLDNPPKIYGQTRFEYAYIADEFRGMIDWDFDEIDIAVIDIEVGSENGFPDPYEANSPITAIAVTFMNKHTFVFGCGEYTNTNDTVTYIQCKDEWTLCRKFLDVWMDRCPDVITGWNVKFFDIPYLVNRFNKILGDDYAKKLSPWSFIRERETTINDKKRIVYEPFGISVLDYIELYKWFSPHGKSQESYRLDNITNVELGERKLSFDEYDNLHDLYQSNYQKFIEYNIRDVELILKLDEKLKLLELALTLAYDTKSNYEDVFQQTRMWDSLTNSYLLDRNIIVPPKIYQEKNSAFEGAYVKDPQVGLHDWVASFDLNSLYPHLIMQYNLSPETMIEVKDYTIEMRNLLSEGITVDKLLKKEINTENLKNVCVTPNGQFFRTDIRGFLPQMMDDMYEDRKKFKKLMLQAKQEYENENNPIKKREIDKRIARYDNLQLAKKLSLNSAYGALGSEYFRFYDLRLALAVTTSGKLSIRWIENKLNQYMNKLLNTDVDYVIASDTDSIYLRLGDLVNKVYGANGEVGLPKQKVIEFMDRVCEDKIQPYIDKSYQELADYVHAYEQKMQMKREALADKGIWTAKKRYILNVYNNEGVQYREPELKVMGLEMIKSSTPSVIRDKMKEIIKLMMTSNEDDVQDFISNFRQEFNNLPAEDISFPRSVNGLKIYSDSSTLYKKGTPIHVKGAIHYNHQLQLLKLDKKYPPIQEGEKIKFTYLKLPNPIKDMVISYPGRLPKEFELQKYIDYDIQFEKAFIDPIKTVLDCINWKTEKTSSLEDFFS